jgi:hypothetical protein
MNCSETFNEINFRFHVRSMPKKNLLTRHEAIAFALLDKPSREAAFEEIALFIETRKLFPERRGGIPMSTQVMLRSTKSAGNYEHLFEADAECFAVDPEALDVGRED